jgi:hypothetical protein
MIRRASDRWLLIAAWTIATYVCTLGLGVVIGAVAGLIMRHDRWQDAVRLLVPAIAVYTLYLPLFSIVAAVVLVPYYLLGFWLWARTAGCRSDLDRRWRSILGAALTLSVPPAVAAALTSAWTSLPVGPFEWPLVPGYMVFYVPVFFVSIVLPRVVIDALGPAAFSKEVPRCDFP